MLISITQESTPKSIVFSFKGSGKLFKSISLGWVFLLFLKGALQTCEYRHGSDRRPRWVTWAKCSHYSFSSPFRQFDFKKSTFYTY